MDGTELRVRRIRAHVEVSELAAELGWSRQRVARIERQAFVKPLIVAEYLRGLATFTTNTTEPNAA